MKPRISVVVTIIMIIMLPKVVKCAKDNDSDKDNNDVNVKCNEDKNKKCVKYNDSEAKDESGKHKDSDGKDTNKDEESKIDESGETEAKL